MTSDNGFDKIGYVFVKSFIDEFTIRTVSRYLEYKILRGEWNDSSSKNDTFTKLAYYADPLIETILFLYSETVSEIVAKKLYPTYSYARIYQPGEQLIPHIDRQSCEYSVTVNVAYKGEPSPIWMKNKLNDSSSFILNSGDAVVYKGCEITHWREVLNQEQLVVQFMLHYVDQNGPYCNYKYDKRNNIGYSREGRI